MERGAGRHEELRARDGSPREGAEHEMLLDHLGHPAVRHKFAEERAGRWQTRRHLEAWRDLHPATLPRRRQNLHAPRLCAFQGSAV